MDHSNNLVNRKADDAADSRFSTNFLNIAVRDILLGIGAYSVARVTEARESVVYVEHGGEFREAA